MASDFMHPGTFRSVVRYLVVGVTANGIGLVVFQALVLLAVWPEIASLLSFFPAFLTAYFLNRSWSFQSDIRHSTGMTRYAVATIACVALQVLIVFLLYRSLHLYPLVAQCIALAIATPISFLLLRHWVFQDEGTAGARNECKTTG